MMRGMSRLYRAPRGAPAPAGWRGRLPAALPRFLAFSAAWHGMALVLALWLGLPLVPGVPRDALIIREIDFLDGASVAAGGGGGRGRVGAPRAAPRPDGRPAPSRTRSGVPARQATAPPASPVPEPDIPAPKAVGPPAPRPPAPAPAPLDVPAPPSDIPAAAPPAAELTRRLEGGAAAGVLPPVRLPEQVAGAGGGRGAGTAAGTGTGSGSGVGSGTGAGTGSGGAGMGGVDTADPDFSQYFRLIKDRVYAAWRYPPGLSGTYRLSLSFILQRDGAAQAVRVVNSSHAGLNESAVAAIRRASPFPPVPEKFRQLAGEPLTMIFTVTVR